MRPNPRNLLAIALCFLPLAAPAAEEPGATAATGDGELPEISGTLGAGALVASGNTESQSANIDLDATVAYEIWRHRVKLTGYQASEDGVDTAERYTASVQSNYQITARSYLFVNASHLSDRFGAFDRRTSLTGGYGRRMLETAAQTLDLEAGAGRRVSEPDGTNDRNYENIVRLFGEFAWSFAESSSFTQSLEVQAGDDNTESESITAVRSRLVQDLSLRLSHTVTHNSDVPAGTDKTDTFTAIAVEYAF